MSYTHAFNAQTNLFVPGHVSEEDAARQTRTARAVLERLETQPGVILADEVGMGKTFVALSVATSVALSDPERRPVVVMVPPALQEKWPLDAETFRNRCLPAELRERLRCRSATTAVEFLKLLDDPPERRSSLIFLSYGTMSPNRRVKDEWVKLAVIQRAIHGRWGAAKLRQRVARWAGTLLRKKSVLGEVWADLLATPAAGWLTVLERHELEPKDGDDPVPLAVREALDALDSSELKELYDELDALPVKASKNLEERLKVARRTLGRVISELWKEILISHSTRLPLVILDEAHHLKNGRTRLASLFHNHEDEELRGPLGGLFERMVFLTATPFQLGHHELCNVLRRFEGISWDAPVAPPAGRAAYRQQLEELLQRLDEAQHQAAHLERSWGRLTQADLRVGEPPYADVDRWWQTVGDSPEEALPARVRAVLQHYRRTDAAMRAAEDSLRRWVIRHLRSRVLPKPHEGVPRRSRRLGGAILPNSASGGAEGLPVSGEALLPFLLAARATACAPKDRPVFAEGLASSYQAFMDTRRANGAGSALDEDDEGADATDPAGAGEWYLKQLEQRIPSGGAQGCAAHPKVSATVSRVLDRWRAGAKVLVFCHYIATGQALRHYISAGIRDEIVRLGAEKLGCAETEVFRRLELLGERFDADRPIGQACRDELAALIAQYPSLGERQEELVAVAIRFLRTPSFLVRFFPLGEEPTPELAVRALRGEGNTASLRDLLRRFLSFLEQRCLEGKRTAYVNALSRIMPGSYGAAHLRETFSPDELDDSDRQLLMPNVRLANGRTKRETRQRLMLTFNTPFFPEVLIASSVMAEGVDLHLNCQHVIHHDLCWNPSTLEQRTGRVDRIGARVEFSGEPIEVYLPYVAETQDEKMFRVVLDRERWFQVVMGERFKTDARSTDLQAARVPLPLAAAEALAFRLEVARPKPIEPEREESALGALQPRATRAPDPVEGR